MGALNHFDLNKFINEFGTKTLIETGSGHGDSLLHALQFPFEKIYSIECNLGCFAECQEKIKDDRVTLINKTSEEGLKELLSKDNGAVLFWLDAHFPEVSAGGVNEDYNKGAEELRYPLENELKLIREYNQTSVILIDDLRIYEDGPYERGPLFSFIKPPVKRGIEFIYKLFPDYSVERDFAGEGYLILTYLTNEI